MSCSLEALGASTGDDAAVGDNVETAGLAAGGIGHNWTWISGTK